MTAPAGSGAQAVPSDKSLLPSLRLGSLDELLVGAVLKAGGPSTVQGSKEALSLSSTTVNFRRFVQKSGPIFVAQDAVEAVLRWEDPAKTVFFAAAWALLCYWPSLVIFIPNVVLVSILLTTYHAKRAGGPPPDSQDGPTPLAKDPPDSSVDYLSNLQNIQIMMGRVADLSDKLRSTVPLLTWRDERVTRALLQLAVVSSFALALVARFIPWRLVFLVLGEGTFLLAHPLVQSFLADATARLQTPQARKARQKATRRLLEDDALLDEELDAEVVEVQRLEVESRAPGASGAAGAKEAEVWGNEAIVGGELPTGFRWLGEWEDAAPADGAVDSDGWTYIHLDGTRTSTPFVVQGDKPTPVWAQSRRRRLTRRAIRIPLL